MSSAENFTQRALSVNVIFQVIVFILITRTDKSEHKCTDQSLHCLSLVQ